MGLEELKEELSRVRKREAELVSEIRKLSSSTSNTKLCRNGLTFDEISRYSRQLLLPEWGVGAQLRLSKTSRGVLVVGAGGLGCPAIQFLAAAGVSPIGVVDYDVVDVTNLHRQILHSESKVGQSKVESVARAVAELNSNVEIRTFKTAIDSKNAMGIVENFDVVIDASDNVATRYLLNDACVIAGKPLVSGSALRFEGQLAVFNYKDGPTYRCLYPHPPPPETVTNCSDGGVIGVVPGVIGCLQAQEAMKILADFGTVLAGKMLLFDGLDMAFRTVKLRPRSASADSISCLIDYEQFCGARASDKDSEVKILGPDDRLDPADYAKFAEKPHVLVDVRSPPEMDICCLAAAINIPIGDVGKPQSIVKLEEAMAGKNCHDIVVVCRKGNDSQRAVVALKAALPPQTVVKDIKGGLHGWADAIDASMPKY